jgi:hypothetical protein
MMRDDQRPAHSDVAWASGTVPMRITGSLDSLPFRALLLRLRETRVTGRIGLIGRDQRGAVILHRGVVQFVVCGPLEDFSLPPLTRIDPNADPFPSLARLLPSEVRLEIQSLTDLVRRGVITSYDREALLRHQTSKAIQELSTWKNAVFAFEELPPPEAKEWIACPPPPFPVLTDPAQESPWSEA